MKRWKRMLACLCAAVLAVTLLAGTQALADTPEMKTMVARLLPSVLQYTA